MINYIQALKVIKKAKIKILDEYIKSTDSLNRISSNNIYSNTDQPKTDNSSFDGFAINSKDTKYLNKKHSQLFRIIGSIAAGDKPLKKKLKKFQAVEIMTGGLVPKGFDSIIPIEQVVFIPNKSKPKFIQISKKIKKNENVRKRGSDFKKREMIIKKGTLIQSNHILAFKSLGIEKIKVKKKPNILFFSSGNEITNKSNILDWQVRNSNNHYLRSLQKNFLFDIKDGGILKDNQENFFQNQIKKMINSKFDLIITSGAVSAGKFDFIPKIIKKFKLSAYFKNVAIRPGKPILFAKFLKKNKAIFGLPGNPISSAACFRFFVYPFLLNSLGIKIEKPIKASLKNGFYKKKLFTRFVKSKLNTTQNGKIQVEILKGQESYKIEPLVNSNSWSILPSGKSKFKKGDILDCFFLNEANKIFN